MSAISAMSTQIDISELADIAKVLSAEDIARFLHTCGYTPQDTEGLPKSSLFRMMLVQWDLWEKEFKGEESVRMVAREMCRASFEFFVRLFWDEVPLSKYLIWNWHMGVLCRELQTVASYVFEGKMPPYHVVCNISPGTSKSTLFSILFQCWVWCKMPSAGFITASHTHSLVLDLSARARDTLKGPLYQYIFPEIKFTESQDAKGHFRNTLGGERFVCTVSGTSPMGKHCNFFICLPYQSAILTKSGYLPIGEIVEKRLPVQVAGYDHNQKKIVWREIEAYESSPGRSLCRITMGDGTWVEATEDHPVYVIGKGYIGAGQVLPGDEVICAGNMQRLRQGGKIEHRREAKSSRVLHSKMLGSTQEERRNFPLCNVSKRILPISWTCKARPKVLFSEVLGKKHNRRKASSFYQHRKGLPGLWQEDSCTTEPIRNELVLQLSVFWQKQNRRKKPQLFPSDIGTMRGLREGDASYPSLSTQNKLLFQTMSTQRAFYGNDRGEKFQLSSWAGLCSISNGIQSSSKKKGPGERAIPMLPVRQNPETKWKGFGGTPHRLEQEQLCHGQSSSPLPYLPRETKWNGEKIVTRTKTVHSVELGLRIPEKVYNLRIKDTHNYFANGILLHNCDDPINPDKALTEDGRKTAEEFITRSASTRRVRGRGEDVFVILLVMQRLGVGDPTDVMLKISKNAGARPVRHICFPAEITEDISPPEFRKFYEGMNIDGKCPANGLMDPVRLSKAVLKEQLSIMGSWSYTGQFLQAPKPLGGGMFKDPWFRHTVPAAPYNANRIRYWDRAASSSISACATAGVLMAYDGDKFYVEDVVYDRWEPDERNEAMLATAKKDRLRYGKYEPIIYVEHEGGSTGKESFLYLVRKLAQNGFTRVRQDVVTGKGGKDTRAEPWADQLAAGNVFLVDNNGRPGWNIEGYITDHLNFRPTPGQKLGREKDRIDASSGAFNLFVGKNRIFQALRTYRLGPNKDKGRRFVVCTLQDLEELQIDEQISCVVIFIGNPQPKAIIEEGEECGTQARSLTEIASPCGRSDTPPPISSPYVLNKTVGTHQLNFADLDASQLQEVWDKPVEPWNKLPQELLLQREEARHLWQFLLKKREQDWGICVVVDLGEEDGRALSLAAGLADGYRLPRSVVFRPSDPDTLCAETSPNPYISETIKSTRNLVHA